MQRLQDDGAEANVQMSSLAGDSKALEVASSIWENKAVIQLLSSRGASITDADKANLAKTQQTHLLSGM